MGKGHCYPLTRQGTSIQCVQEELGALKIADFGLSKSLKLPKPHHGSGHRMDASHNSRASVDCSMSNMSGKE